MTKMLPASRVAATNAALQRLKQQHGAGARFGEWLLRTYAFDAGRSIDLKAAETRIIDDWGVSSITAWRWRRGCLPPMQTLEEMRKRWGVEFVAFLFAEADAAQRDLLWQLRDLESRTADLPERAAIRERLREALLGMLETGDALNRIAIARPPDPLSSLAVAAFQALLRSELRKTFGGRLRLATGRV